MFLCFFVSSRRRHTRCALVTGVQTCALPIYGVAILARGTQPVEVQRGLAGEAEDEQSRYLEADVFGVRVASIYLPNGNPQPGPKFDYKLRWKIGRASCRERVCQYV